MHRRSIRYGDYDYTQPGAYFVTLVTHQRQCIFGEIENGVIRLNSYGLITQSEWIRSAHLRPYIRLEPEEFIVMPNHVHGIIWIVDTNPRRGAATLRPYKAQNDHRSSVASASLGAVIRAYKSAVTYQIHKLGNGNISSVWQRKYYEHIIRNDKEVDDISLYILANPDQWANDPENLPISS